MSLGVQKPATSTISTAGVFTFTSATKHFKLTHAERTEVLIPQLLTVMLPHSQPKGTGT